MNLIIKLKFKILKHWHNCTGFRLFVGHFHVLHGDLPVDLFWPNFLLGCFYFEFMLLSQLVVIMGVRESNSLPCISNMLLFIVHSILCRRLLLVCGQICQLFLLRFLRFSSCWQKLTFNSKTSLPFSGHSLSKSWRTWACIFMVSHFRTHLPSGSVHFPLQMD